MVAVGGCNPTMLALSSAIVALISSRFSSATPDRTTDYCQSHYFIANCSNDAVILMQSAKYGRMLSGRCGTGAYGNIGCNVDVLWYLDWRCSGRHQCKIYVADKVLHRVDPCQSDLKSYLEARYSCVTISQATFSRGDDVDAVPNDDCRQSTISVVTEATSPSETPTPSVGYLSSISQASWLPNRRRRPDKPETIADRTGNGNEYNNEERADDAVENSCPTWVIEAAPGQKIRLTMAAFGGTNIGKSHLVDQSPETDEEVSRLVASVRSTSCYELGTVSSGQISKAIVAGNSNWRQLSEPLGVCGPSRGVVIYQSSGHRLSIRLHHSAVLDEWSPFVIKYEVFGCQPLKAPSGGWLRVDSEVTTAVIGCNSTDELWHFRCSGSRWNGSPIGNCSTTVASGGSAWGASPMYQMDDSFPYGVLLVVAIGVALGVFIGGILLTVVALLMKRRSSTREADRHRAELNLLHATDPSDTYISATTYRHYQPHHGHLLPQTQISERRQHAYVDQHQQQSLATSCDEHRLGTSLQAQHQFYHRLPAPFTAAEDSSPRCVVNKTTLSTSSDDVVECNGCQLSDYGPSNLTVVAGGSLCTMGVGTHLYEPGFNCCTTVTDVLQTKQLQQQLMSGKSSSGEHQGATLKLSI